MNYPYNNTVFPNQDYRLISIIDAEWKIAEYSSEITYREKHPIDDIDYVFCGILEKVGGVLSKVDFARILGFSLQDIPEKNIYRDNAEETVFNALLNERVLFGLITDSKGTLELTDAGKMSLEDKTKFRDWAGTFNYFKHDYICDNTDFSFSKILGKQARLLSKENPPDKSKKRLRNNSQNEPDFQLLNTQLYEISNGGLELISTNDISKKNCENPTVQYALFQNKEGDNTLLVLVESEVQSELTAIINDLQNETDKAKIALKCEFKAFSENNNAIFDGIILKKYIKLWNNSHFIKDPRVQWADDDLWVAFDSLFNVNDWYCISEVAQIEILKNRIPQFKHRLNWAVLSERLDEEYIYEHLYTEGYRWDFEILSNRDSEFVWLLINDINNYNSNKEKEQQIIANWNFLLITDNLSEEQVKFLLPYKFKLDFFQLSKKQPNFVLSCLNEISRINENLLDNTEHYKANWDWGYISDNWGIEVIWDNIAILEDRLNWHTFIKRIFSDPSFSDKFLQNNDFRDKLLKNREDIKPTFRLENLIWSDQLIDLFNDAEILRWESNDSQLGFECNLFVEWTPFRFQKYAPLITTYIGQVHFSKSIKSWEFVFQTLDFKWNWLELSQNLNFDLDIDILNRFKTDLDWTILSRRMDEAFILNHLLDFDWDFDVLSTQKSDSFIKAALTQTDAIIEKKWNWKHLTAQLDNDFIIQNLTIINEKWDWTHLTRKKFTKNEIIELCQYTVEFWDWSFLLATSFTVKELTDDDFFILIASYLNLIENEESRKKYWSILTKKLPPDFFIQNDCENLSYIHELVQWDWSYLSQHPRFDFTIDFIQKFEKKWDWSVLSKNKRINANWTYLDKFIRLWDWTYLSEYSKFLCAKTGDLNKKNLNWFHQFIDFKSFSKRKDITIDNLLINAFKHKDWDFGVLSNVKSVKKTQEFLRKYADRNWDWKKLSEQELKTEIKKNASGKNFSEPFINELILEFQNKGWNWQFLSKREDIRFDFNFISQLANEKWDFQEISKNPQTVWNNDLIKFVSKNKVELNWTYISKNNEAIFSSLDNMDALKENLDWDSLSSNPKVQITDESLEKFKNYWNWKKLSENKSFKLEEELIEKYKDKFFFSVLTRRQEVINNPALFIKYKEKDWDWTYISTNEVIFSNLDNLDALKESLDWNSLSSNPKVQITDKSLEKFKNYWNWTILSENKNLSINLTRDLVLKFDTFWDFTKIYINQNSYSSEVKAVLQPYFEKPAIQFLIKLAEQDSEWRGYAYHFAHLSNAAEIIKQSAIKSRNSANQVSDSAGSVVNRRHTAHDFARFYFRPQTPTQFYNENLGKSPSDDYKLKQWKYFDGYQWIRESKVKYVGEYQKAANMNFPKCPIPIFFKISIKELFNKHFQNCYASDANMQTNRANVFPIHKVLPHFNFRDLYSTIGNTRDGNWKSYINASQQEFLVKNELSLSDLETLEIVCQTETDKEALINLIGSEHSFVDKITVERQGVYHNDNSRFNINVSDKSLSVSTDFGGDGTVIVKTETDNCISQANGEIYSQKPKITEGGKNLQITFSKPTQYQVWFKDESKREWLLYSTPLELPKRDEKPTIDIQNGNLLPQDIISYIKSVNSDLTDTYAQKVRHYVLERHTLLVMSEFEKHFSTVQLPINRNLFRFMLALHDIGKPKAAQFGNKNNQYQYTVEIIDGLRKTLPFSSSDMDIMTLLVCDDPIGLFIQDNISLEMAKNKIIQLANRAKMSPLTFFKLLSIYYQSDTGSYTADAGGLHFLEHLFTYRSGTKVFDSEKQRLKFSPSIESKFTELQKSVENAI